MRIPGMLAIAFLAMIGCGKPPPSLQPPEPPIVTVQNPVDMELDSYVEFTGYLRSVESMEVRAQVTGYLKTVYFETAEDGVLNGGMVKEGDKLYEIDPEPYDAALNTAKASLAKALADVATAEANERQAKADLERTLKSGSATSKQDLDKYKAAADTADANIKSSKAAVDSAKAAIMKAEFDRKNCTIVSHVKGVARITRTLLTKGNLVQAGQTVLCKISSLDPIHAYFDVDELTSLKYRRKIDAKELEDPLKGGRLKCEIALKDEVGYPHKGEVDYVDPEISRNTGTREVRALFKNPKYRLSPGDSVRIRVEAGRPFRAILVPEVAVGNQLRQKFVYVVNAKNEVEFRPVVLGEVRMIDGVAQQIIESGVTPAEKIIVNGLLRVRPGVVVQSKEAPLKSAPPTAEKAK